MAHAAKRHIASSTGVILPIRSVAVQTDPPARKKKGTDKLRGAVSAMRLAARTGGMPMSVAAMAMAGKGGAGAAVGGAGGILALAKAASSAECSSAADGCAMGGDAGATQSSRWEGKESVEILEAKVCGE